jgi:hypothetical protein
MAKRALLVGINDYITAPKLKCCVNDARAVAEVLERHDNRDKNFDCEVLAGTGTTIVTRALLREHWERLFADFQDDILFYFSGHGTPTDGGILVTQDGVANDLGLSMQALMDMANGCKARTVLIILDCCSSGAAGNTSGIQSGNTEGRVLLREGVTILTASRSSENAIEVNGHGVFTFLLLNALKGGAANLRGHVSAAALYAYAEAALGAFSQRPLYKSHAAHLEPVRICAPVVSDDLLREIPTLFPTEGHVFMLDPTYEETNQGCAVPAHVAIFKKLKRLQIAGLVRPRAGDDLYWSPERSGGVILTSLGDFYWRLATTKRI